MNKFKPYNKHDPYSEDLTHEANAYCQCKTLISYYDKEQDKFICPNCRKIKDDYYNNKEAK